MHLLKPFWKYRYKIIIGWVIALLTAILVNPQHLFYDVAFSLLFVIKDIFQLEATAEKIKRLKAKGLTERDLLNIEFVKKWEYDRTAGLWPFCVKYGLIIGAFGFSLAGMLIYGIIYNTEFKIILSDPGSMFHFLGIAYIIGAFLGVIFFRISWYFNEKRFMRLTDPLNTIFNSKRVSFYGHL